MTSFADLTRNQKRWLARRQCAWCNARLDADWCGAIYERCSTENRQLRLERCLAEYKPRNQQKEDAITA
jgi:hypothetical protein